MDFEYMWIQYMLSKSSVLIQLSMKYHIELSHNPWIRDEIIMCVFKNRFIQITRIFPTLYLLRMYTGKYFCPNYSTLLFDYMAEF